MVAPREGGRASARACESRRRGACDVYGGGEARGGAAGLPFRRAPRRRGGGDAATANVQRPQPPGGARRGAHGPARVEPMAAAAAPGIALTGHSPGSRGSSAPAGGRPRDRTRRPQVAPRLRLPRREKGLALREARATANAAAAAAAAATSTRFSLGMATNPGLAPRPRPRLRAVRTRLLPLRASRLAALTSPPPRIPGIGCAVGVRGELANYNTAFPL